MLKVTNLSKSYGAQVLFEDVSFTLGQGERVGLVGRNGHGKSTLFRLITGVEEPDSGSISVPRHYHVGTLAQHIAFTHDTVLAEASSGLKKENEWTDETYKAKKILSGLGIPEESFGESPLKLSGGYQIRLNLAKLLASEPDLLLLDEPTNYLDIVSIRWLKRFLREWKGEFIVITHDRDFMDSVTTHTLGIHRQKIRKVEGPTGKLYSQIILEEEVHERTRMNDDKKRAEVERFIARFRASATKASAVQSKIKLLEKKERLDKLQEIRTLDFEFNSAPFHGKWLVEAEDISFGYTPEEQLIRDLRLAIGKKDRIAVIGKNGRGKTTLLNMLAGEIRPLYGEIKRHPDARPAYFGQTNINRLSLDNTIERELMEADPDFNRAKARKTAGAMMFPGDMALKKISVLSGGERSRVLIGKLLLCPSNILFLDEPTNHLDMDSIDSLTEAIDAFGGAVVIVTHSEMILKAVAKRLVVFDGGKVSVFEGTYDEFLEKVGWMSESEAASGASDPEPKARAARGAGRKELKKLRAGIVAEKSRVVAPLQRRISEIEDSIIALEKEAELSSRALLEASQNGDPSAITLHSRTYHDARRRIDALFSELEGLSAECDRKTRDFDRRIEECE